VTPRAALLDDSGARVLDSAEGVRSALDRIAEAVAERPELLSADQTSANEVARANDPIMMQTAEGVLFGVALGNKAFAAGVSPSIRINNDRHSGISERDILRFKSATHPARPSWPTSTARPRRSRSRCVATAKRPRQRRPEKPG
jgi:hypothetical protein